MNENMKENLEETNENLDSGKTVLPEIMNESLGMNKKLKIGILVTVCVLFLALLGVVLAIFLNPVEHFLPEAYELAAEPESMEISIKETAVFTAEPRVTDEKLAAKLTEKYDAAVLTYRSSDESVAVIDSEGHITPVSPGTATMTAAWDELEKTCEVTVYAVLESIGLEADADLVIHDEYDLAYAVIPANARLSDTLQFYSDDEKVCTVDENGHVTAIGPGAAIITMKLGKFRRFCVIRVTSPMTDLLFEEDGEEITLSRGDTREFTAVVLPEDTTDDKTLTWTSSDEAVGTIDAQGLFTAVDAGDTVVTVSAGKFSRSCSIHVEIPLESISLPAKLELRYPDSVQLPITYFPVDTTADTTTEWTSSNESVVTVDETGKITAVNAGTADITAVCGEFEAKCTVTVIIPVTSVSISQGEMTLVKGASAQLSAAVGPANTTEERTIDWASDNAKAATVSGGTVTAVGAGDAVILASHGDYSAACRVHVLSPMTGIGMDQKSISVIETSTATLSVHYLPEDTTDSRALTWTTSDPAVATVSNGTVTAVSVGTCTITATCGTFSTTAAVNVTEYIEVESLTIDKSSLSLSGPGDKAKITAAVAPSNASAGVTYSSSNNNVAKVSGDGTVTATGSGDCVITAKAGSKTASCNVHVEKANIVVVLDPGHDSAHPGAFYGGYREEIINNIVSKATRDYLLSHYSGVTVYLTHENMEHFSTNNSVELEQRAQFAQDKGAAILVSQHFNASAAHTASGCLAFVSYQPNVAAASSALGNSILAEISGRMGLKNLGCVTTRSDSYFDQYGNPLDYYAINRHAANRGIPGIIVEHCFMDRDTGYMTNDKLQQFGVCDAIGIANYLGLPAK